MNSCIWLYTCLLVYLHKLMNAYRRTTLESWHPGAYGFAHGWVYASSGVNSVYSNIQPFVIMISFASWARDTVYIMRPHVPLCMRPYSYGKIIVEITVLDDRIPLNAENRSHWMENLLECRYKRRNVISENIILIIMLFLHRLPQQLEELMMLFKIEKERDHWTVRRHLLTKIAADQLFWICPLLHFK